MVIWVAPLEAALNVNLYCKQYHSAVSKYEGRTRYVIIVHKDMRFLWE